MMKFNLKEFREKLNVEPPPGAPAKVATPGFSDVAIVKIGVKKMAFRGKSQKILVTHSFGRCHQLSTIFFITDLSAEVVTIKVSLI